MEKEEKAIEKAMEPWSYEKSVAIAKHHFNMSEKYKLDLVRELYAARMTLSNQGYRGDLTSGQMSGSPYSWESYCEAVGIVRRTAERWITLYDVKADCLISVEEFKARKLLEFEGLIKQLEASVGRPADWRPEGWCTACENYYQSKMKQKKYLEIAQRQVFDQAELFNREYLSSLSDRFDVASPEEILEFGRLCEDMKPYAVKAVPVPKQVRVVKLVEAALAEFQPSVRKDVARFVAEMIIRMGAENE
jgi:hypothetical protein